MTTLSELLDLYVDEEIIDELMCEYPDQEKNAPGFYAALEELRALVPLETDVVLCLSPVLDEDGNEEYINVHGLPDEEGVEPGLMFMPWCEWLGAQVEQATLVNFFGVSIISFCLFEMTYLGYSSRDVAEKGEEILADFSDEEIDEMLEEDEAEDWLE